MSKLKSELKAKELSEKFFAINDDEKSKLGTNPFISREYSIYCALLSVEEILNINSVDKDYDLSNYWQEVKEELLKLKNTK